MTDSELLMNGYLALHEAHTVAGVLVREIHDRQEMGQPVKASEHLASFRRVLEQSELAVAAFDNLERRAEGTSADTHGRTHAKRKE